MLHAICGLTHREGYRDIAVVAMAAPIIALIVPITLETLPGRYWQRQPARRPRLRGYPADRPVTCLPADSWALSSAW
jgi:hypothetical protein